MSVSVCLGGQVFGAGLIRRQEKGFVGNLRGRRQPAFEGRGVDERLEAGSWLPPCLRDAVEFVRVEIESSDQRFYGAVLGAYGDERRLYRRHVDDFPVIAVAVHVYHRAAVDVFAGFGVLSQAAGDDEIGGASCRERVCPYG